MVAGGGATELLESGRMRDCDWEGGRSERGSFMPSNHGMRSTSRAVRRRRGSMTSAPFKSCICNFGIRRT